MDLEIKMAFKEGWIYVMYYDADLKEWIALGHKDSLIEAAALIEQKLRRS